MTPKPSTQTPNDETAHNDTVTAPPPAAIAAATASLATQVKNIVTDKTRLEERTAKMIAELNQELPALGYKIIGVNEASNGNGTDVAVDKPKRGRPKGSVNTTARKNLKCNKCGQKFSHAMHLGRHVSSAHPRKGGKK